MSDFQFVCPFCDANIECPEEYNGVEIECPVCKETIVPTPMQAEKENQDFIEDNVSLAKQQKKKTKHFAKKLDALGGNEINKEKKQSPPFTWGNQINDKYTLLKAITIKNKMFVCIALVFIVVLFIILGLLGVFKDCIKKEPQVYVNAQQEVLDFLLYSEDDIPIASKHSAEKWMKKTRDCISFYHIEYAKQYLGCNGKCGKHSKKYAQINLFRTETISFNRSILVFLEKFAEIEKKEEKADAAIKDARKELFNTEWKLREANISYETAKKMTFNKPLNFSDWSLPIQQKFKKDFESNKNKEINEAIRLVDSAKKAKNNAEIDFKRAKEYKNIVLKEIKEIEKKAKEEIEPILKKYKKVVQATILSINDFSEFNKQQRRQVTDGVSK